MSEFGHDGYRIRYDTYGDGDRVVILAHGLLMNRGMHSRLGAALAARGHRVVCVDLLGHGRSDRPEDLRLYSMPRFARQVSKLIDHLGIDSAVVGGTSLGANVGLELATREPSKVRGLVIEMPVLDNALTGVAAFFTPIMLGLRFGRPVLELTSRIASAIPRSHYLVDMSLDLLRQSPGPSLAVLEGLLAGESAPHSEERRTIEQPTLIVGHNNDPVHPFSDSGMLAEELENATLIEANSILEWRLTPGRLDDELSKFLDRVWAEEQLPDPALA